ncbi:MAG: alpha/beta hydrolase, partial [Planctomycetota bacterium]
SFFSVCHADTAGMKPLTERSRVYKNVDGRELRFDITQPGDWGSEVTDRPAVVFFHGGGWTGGKPGQFAEHSKQLARLGMVCFRVEYRLLDKKKKEPPAICAEDASDAFRFIRGRAAEFGIDPNRIAAGGGSAGGHLAAYLGMMDDESRDGVSRKPNALLLFNPVYDNGPGGWGTQRVGDAYPEYSPAQNISADDPPAIVFLGTEDKLIPVETAKRFQEAMQDKQIRSDLELFAGEGHGFFNADRAKGKHYRKTMDSTVAFLQSLKWIP